MGAEQLTNWNGRGQTENGQIVSNLSYSNKNTFRNASLVIYKVREWVKDKYVHEEHWQQLL